MRKLLLLRAGGFVLSGLAGLAAMWLTAHGLRARRPLTEAPPSIPRETALRAFESERAIARALGMTRSAEGDAPLTHRNDSQGIWTLRVPVAARECIAVIAAVYGHHAPTALALQSVTDDPSHIATDASEPITLERTDGGLVLQVQWCQAEERPRNAVLETRVIAPEASPRPWTGTVHYGVFRAPWNTVGGPMRLRRGTPRAWALRQFPPEYALEEGDRSIPSDGRLLGTPIPIHTQGARLIPGTDATYRTLYTLVKGESSLPVNPRVDASHIPSDPWASGLPNNFSELYATLRGDVPTPRLHEPVFDTGTQQRRVLAVVDTEHLGAPCVLLHFTRLLFLHAASLRRHDMGVSRTDIDLTSQENTAHDRRCPAQGISVYSVPDTDREDWLLRVFALPTADPLEGTIARAEAREPHPRHHRRGHPRR